MRITLVVQGAETVPSIGETVSLIRVQEKEGARPKIGIVRRFNHRNVGKYLENSLARVRSVERTQPDTFEVTLEPVDLGRFRVPAKRGRKPKVIDREKIAELRRMRERLGIRSCELAEAMGVSRQAYSQIEVGRRSLTPAMEQRILDTLELLRNKRERTPRCAP